MDRSWNEQQNELGFLFSTQFVCCVNILQVSTTMAMLMNGEVAFTRLSMFHV
jgi:hypothetical protein